MVRSTLAGIHWDNLSFVALGCSNGTAIFTGAIKANTSNLINNNKLIKDLLKDLKNK